MSETVLVTGSAGFIGSHLTERLLQDGHKVRAMTHYNFQNNWGWLDDLPVELRQNLEVVAGDVCDPFFVNDAIKGVTKVFHLASLIAIPYSYKAPSSYVDTNIRGSMHVFEACRAHDVGLVIHTSTSETYGSAQYVPIDEKHPLVAQSPYAATKISADKIAEAYHLSFGLPVITVRPFNTFGPRQSARAVIPTIMTQALSGADPVYLGALDPVRDLNYVKDTVEGFIAAANCPDAVGKVVNLGRGEGISIRDLAREILSICASDARIESRQSRTRPPDSEVTQLIASNTLAKDLLDWAPTYTLREALEETVAWFKDNLSYYKPDIYNI